MGIELREIEVAGLSRKFQLRTTLPKERAAQVVECVKQHGVLQVPRIDANGNVVLGDVPVWAARAAGQPKIAALVDDREVTEAEALRLQLCEDLQSVPLKPTERASGFKRLMALENCSASEVAASVGAKACSISRLFKIVELEPEFLELVDAGTLGESKAYELSLMTPAERLSLLPAIKKGTVTRDDLMALRQGTSGVASGGEPRTQQTVKVILEGGRTVTVRGPDLDMKEYIGAIETLLRSAKKAMSRGLDLDGFARAAKRKKDTLATG